MELTQNKQFAKPMKDNQNNLAAGVLSGLAKFLGFNVMLLRAAFVVLGLLGLFVDSGLFILVALSYAAGFFLMPDYTKENDKETYEYRAQTGTSATGD